MLTTARLLKIDTYPTPSRLVYLRKSFFRENGADKCPRVNTNLSLRAFDSKPVA